MQFHEFAAQIAFSDKARACQAANLPSDLCLKVREVLRLEHEWWCPGYSEPGAGASFASLRTRALRRSDKYVVIGQKLWTAWAHVADWMFCLVLSRTEAKPQQGISFLLIDMKPPDINVKPINSIDGVHDLNEVFLVHVEPPVDDLLG